MTKHTLRISSLTGDEVKFLDMIRRINSGFFSGSIGRPDQRKLVKSRLETNTRVDHTRHFKSEGLFYWRLFEMFRKAERALPNVFTDQFPIETI